ncbi:MAG: hypothetical protein FWE19_05720 [Oscillospiraceae bacterium]|nr:hypothetical protein [Oscillospiraceae bacterium]
MKKVGRSFFCAVAALFYILVVGFGPVQAAEQPTQDPSAAHVLTFREGAEVGENGLPAGITAENIILTEADVQIASASAWPMDAFGQIQHAVELTLYESGREAFAEVTTRLAPIGGQISIWVGDEMISAPAVHVPITDGVAVISGGFTAAEAAVLAGQITGQPQVIPVADTRSPFHTSEIIEYRYMSLWEMVASDIIGVLILFA